MSAPSPELFDTPLHAFMKLSLWRRFAILCKIVFVVLFLIPVFREREYAQHWAYFFFPVLCALSEMPFARKCRTELDILFVGFTLVIVAYLVHFEFFLRID